jgi:S1-C subfamily serine protease
MAAPPAVERPASAAVPDVVFLLGTVPSTAAVRLSTSLAVARREVAKAVGTDLFSFIDGARLEAIPRAHETRHVLRSVVKIYATVSAPNHLIPWQRKLQTNVTGSGFVVDEKRRLVVTNAHVIGCASFIEVRKHGDAKRYEAHACFVGAECDLAVLWIADDAFWACGTVSELRFEGGDDSKVGAESFAAIGAFEGMPALQRNVKVVGYPMGGDQISITSGVVSRIDMAPYGGADVSLSSVQLDAAINPGNSGGPALCGARVVGVAFQTLTSGDNIGYIITNPVISVFMRGYLAHEAAARGDMARAYHAGFPMLGMVYQDATNETLRRRYALPDGVTGVLVEHLLARGIGRAVLRGDDVVTHVNGMQVANDATVEWRPKERLRFSHILQMTDPGEVCRLTVWRGGAAVELAVAAEVRRTALLPNHLFNAAFKETPVFRLFAGFVFTTASLPYLVEWGNEWFSTAPRWLVNLMQCGEATEARDQAVVISQLLPHGVNKGYTSELVGNRIVDSVNGTAVRNFAHLVALLDAVEADAEGAPTATVLLSNGYTTSTIVLPVAAAKVADAELCGMYGIPAQPNKALASTPTAQVSS